MRYTSEGALEWQLFVYNENFSLISLVDLQKMLW